MSTRFESTFLLQPYRFAMSKQSPGVKNTFAPVNLKTIHFFSCYTCINNIWNIWLGVSCFESSYDHMLEEWHQTTYLNKWLWWCCKHDFKSREMVHCLLLCKKKKKKKKKSTRKHENDEFHAIWNKPVVYCIQYCSTLTSSVSNEDRSPLTITEDRSVLLIVTDRVLLPILLEAVISKGSICMEITSVK